MGTNRNRRFHLNIRKHFFTMRMAEQVTQKRFWSLPPWIYSRLVWTWSWASGCRCPCLITGVGQDDFQRSLSFLSHSVSLWKQTCTAVDVSELFVGIDSDHYLLLLYLDVGFLSPNTQAKIPFLQQMQMWKVIPYRNFMPPHCYCKCANAA